MRSEEKLQIASNNDALLPFPFFMVNKRFLANCRRRRQRKKLVPQDAVSRTPEEI